MKDRFRTFCQICCLILQAKIITGSPSSSQDRTFARWEKICCGGFTKCRRGVIGRKKNVPMTHRPWLEHLVSSFNSFLLWAWVVYSSGSIFNSAVKERSWVYFTPTGSSHHLSIFTILSNDGGGGERVLWLLIQSLQSLPGAKKFEIVVYSGDVDVSGDEILKKAEDRFGIRLAPVRFVPLYTRNFVEKKWWGHHCDSAHLVRYPRFTMIGQSLGSMVVGLEALFRQRPTVFLGIPKLKYAAQSLTSQIRWGILSHFLSSDSWEDVLLDATSTIRPLAPICFLKSSHHIPTSIMTNRSPRVLWKLL